jgi:hypothetical protein
MKLVIADGNTDFVYDLAGKVVLSRQEEGLMNNTRGH